MGAPIATRDDGPAVEMDIVGDMVRHALPLAPVLIVASALFWGWAGALSSGYAVVLVVLNFLVAAALMSWSARISLGLMMGVALGGYLVRLALLFVAVYVVKDLWWFEPVPLGLTLIVTHLGLLFWETRYVSASLAFPGLKPPAHPSRDHAAKESLR
jgi:hypothetical protein